MKTITIKQPWASLIVHGIKDVENRTWKTNYRGRVLIHAASKLAIKRSLFCNILPFDVPEIRLNWYEWAWKKDYTTSAIIGSVEIVDCVINHPSIWSEKTEMMRTQILDEFVLVPKNKPIYNWVLANPILFEEPILNVKGHLSFWNYEQIP